MLRHVCDVCGKVIESERADRITLKHCRVDRFHMRSGAGVLIEWDLCGDCWEYFKGKVDELLELEEK